MSGFTLVELLVTISIIAILAGLLLGVTAVAAESGREAKTKQMIARLHTLLMEQYDTFRDRRVALDQRAVGGVPRTLAPFGITTVAQLNGLSPTERGQLRAAVRLAGAREQMKMEMPDRWSDFVLESLGDDAMADAIDPSTVTTEPTFLQTFPSLAQIYRRRYDAIWDATNSITGAQNTAGDLRNNQSAECLYMVVLFATGDGEARSLFKDNEIGDTDGDGAPEFLDGWGNPIQFLRWAPGFRSDLQLSVPRLEEVGAEAESRPTPVDAQDAIRDAVADNPDPLDLFRIDQPLNMGNPFGAEQLRGFRLVPLVYSAGRDEGFGVENATASERRRQDPEPFLNVSSDPYVDIDSDAPGLQMLGEALTDTQADNLTNHLITSN